MILVSVFSPAALTLKLFLKSWTENPWINEPWRKLPQKAVGGWTSPSEKYVRQIGSSPQVAGGEKYQKSWVATTKINQKNCPPDVSPTPKNSKKTTDWPLPGFYILRRRCFLHNPQYLVGGFKFQPIWKILVKMGIFPQFSGVKIKNSWNHLPDTISSN